MLKSNGSFLLVCALLLFSSSHALACSVDLQAIDWSEYSDEHNLKRADAVVVGTVKAADLAPDVEPKRFMYRTSVEVESWIKGGQGEKTIEVLESGGTNCDPVFGIQRLRNYAVMASETNPYPTQRGLRLKIFMERKQGKLHAFDATPMN